jgi:hypothetical protein
VSPRRNQNRRGASTPADAAERAESLERSFGHQRVESAADGDWVVRSVAGAAAGKTYRCPGCDQEIRTGAPHLVAWPADGGGLEDRRHWHTPCWNARSRRRPR